MGVEFPSTTSHYLTTENVMLDSRGVENAIKAVTSKGYGPVAGAQLLVLCNEREADLISTWRRGLPSREPSEDELTINPDAIGPIAKYDFVLSKSAPAYLTEETIVGRQAPEEFNGLPVFGSYGDALVIKSTLIPAGYLIVAATGGPGSDMNPIAIRQHPTADYQGLRVIPGADSQYPITNSFLQRSFGVGAKHRGAAAVLQVTASSTYTAPVFVV